jgi:hypothetical protein
MSNFIRKVRGYYSEVCSQLLDELNQVKEDLWKHEEYLYGDPFILENSLKLFGSIEHKEFVICVIKGSSSMGS